jgi:glutamine synthetase
MSAGYKSAPASSRSEASPSAIQRVRERISQTGVTRLRFELPDTHGIARSKIIPVTQLEVFGRKGLNMYGGTLGLDVQSDVVSDTGYAEEIHYGDHFLFPDFDTFCVVPWETHTARIICDPEFSHGAPCSAAPRLVLKQVLNQFGSLGLDVLSAHELEFYILDRDKHQPVFAGKHIFANLRNTCCPLVEQILTNLERMGIEILTLNCEYAPGQIEVTYAPHPGIKGADVAYTIKNAIKELAQSGGFVATSMSKPFSDLAGCGAHYHCSLISQKDGANAFNDDDLPEGLSQLAQYFLGGLLKHMRSIMALLAPTINCYKRYRPHSFAPINVSWGYEDRTAAVRVKAGKGANVHLENRIASGASNPYLAAAGTLAAGFCGIKNKVEPPAASMESADNRNLPPLPSSLTESLECLESDGEIRAMLGEEFVHLFTAVKRHEITKFSDTVTDFERREYLEFL